MTSLSSTIITEEAFIERFRPMPNELNDNASFNFGAGGCLYETFGRELEHVRRQPEARVWTILECDGDLVIASGYHRVNRLGYILTAEARSGDTTI